MSDDRLEVTARDGKRLHFAWSDDHRAWLLPPGYDDAITALCDALLDARRADDTRELALELVTALQGARDCIVELTRDDNPEDDDPDASGIMERSDALLASDRVRRLLAACRPQQAREG